ncbi:MAG: tRNA (guanosine(46)-N7)-methyltransferase TrmB [Phycisphaerales bacterium]
MSFGLARGRTLDTGEIGLAQADLPEFDEQPVIDPRAWFGSARQHAPFELEIGSGKGTFLVQQAVLQPDTNFLGVEWAGEFYRYAADRVRRRGLENVRLLHTDAIEFLTHRAPAEICRTIHLYFPDPWPKKRHHKRRSVQDATLPVFYRALRPGGELRIVTDHDDYWAWIDERLARASALFERLPFDRPESAGDEEVVGTNFERKYRREGRPFHAVTLRRR